MSKTLYISDLDGTLLNPDKEITDKTANIINALIRKGVLFTYATARSLFSASRLTCKLNINCPVIVNNGAFIIDNVTGQILHSCYFDEKEYAEIAAELSRRDIQPIVYFNDFGSERFAYTFGKMNDASLEFLSRRKDERETPVTDIYSLRLEKAYYFTCIAEEDKIYGAYTALKQKYSCVFQRNIYTGNMQFEFMPKGVTKAGATAILKEIIRPDKTVSFGDGINDLAMFKEADECYAVENADEALKSAATAVIQGNNNDGVANWLQSNAGI